MPHRGAPSFAEQNSPGSACPAWPECQQIQHGFFACVYRFSKTLKQLSTVSANEEKKCLVKSGKVKNCNDANFPRRTENVSAPDGKFDPTIDEH